MNRGIVVGLAFALSAGLASVAARTSTGHPVQALADGIAALH